MNFKFRLFNYLHTLLNLSKGLSSMKRLKGYLFIFVFLNSGFLSLISNPANSELQKKGNIGSSLVNSEIKNSFSNILFSSSKEFNQIKFTELGKKIKIKRELKKNNLKLFLYGELSKIETQSISKPSEGIELAAITSSAKKIEINIFFAEYIDLSNLQIKQNNNEISIKYKRGNPKILANSDIFKIKKISNNESKVTKQRATAPPLGDIATGTTIIPNPNLLNLEGPDIPLLIFKQTPAKIAIERLLSKSDYSFVWVQQDPAYNASNQINNSTSSNQLGSPNNSASQTGLVPPTQGQSSQTSTQSTNADTPRLITLSIENKSFSTAFNSILIASGLQARKVSDIIYVGPNVRDTAFTERVSKVYRLNQTTANAAASYLANLGAKVTKTSSITTAVSTGSSQASTVGASSSTTNTGTTTKVQVYGSDIGPLVGLIATTDDRLQTITLIGSNDLINVAEDFLKKLDLRQRQVAISIKVLDINLVDGSGLSNSWALKQNNNFIVNDNGKLLGAFGNTLPANSTDFEDANTVQTTTIDTTSTPAINGFVFNGRTRISPGVGVADGDFVNFLRAEITSTNTKILASPTLIVNEFPGESGGTNVAFSDISAILKTGTIGRSFGNEAFVIVGSQVPINCTAEGEASVPSFTYGISGLTFGARVVSVDDNGFITFALSPAVSAPSERRTIIGCGDIDLLSIRRLDTGFIRVRDGNTLILTGVLQNEDKETTTKFPFFGDLPLIGQFFRSTTSAQSRRELVILVTPQILEDNEQYDSNLNSAYKPTNPEAVKAFEEN